MISTGQRVRRGDERNMECDAGHFRSQNYKLYITIYITINYISLPSTFHLAELNHRTPPNWRLGMEIEMRFSYVSRKRTKWVWWKKPSSLVNKPSMRNLYISFLRRLLSPPRSRKHTLTSHTISTMCLMGHIQSSYICNKHLDPISYTALYNSQIASPIYINSSIRFHGGGGGSVRGSRLERAVFHRKREKANNLELLET